MTIQFNFTKKHLAIIIALLVVIAGLIWYLQRDNKKQASNLSGTEVNYEEQQQELKDLRALAEKSGVVAAYAKVKEQYGANQVTGHDYAHFIGKLAYEQMKNDSFSVCDSEFGFGCFHGLLEALVRDQGIGGFDIARTSCNKLASPGQVASCLHGLGHGVMGYKGNIDKAIDECKNFATNERIYCYDGSYMEYYTGVMEDFSKAQNIDENNPWQFCLGQYSEAQSQCVRNQTLGLVYKSGMNAKIAGQCNVLKKDLQEYCVSTVGLYAAQSSGVNIVAVKTVCKNFTGAAQYSLCVQSSAREFVFQNNVPMAERLCSSDTAIKQACDAAVTQIRKEYNR
jgi:hypothetical protein